MRYLPAAEFILVRQDNAEEMTKGGIFKPDMAMEDTLRGTAIAVGNHVTGVVAGDRLIWGKYAGTVMDKKGEEFRGTVQIRVQDVLGLIDCAEDEPGAVELAPQVPEGAESVTS